MMTIGVAMVAGPALIGNAVVTPIAPLVPVTLAQVGGLSIVGTAAALAVAVLVLCTSRVEARRHRRSTQDVAVTVERQRSAA